MRPCKKTAAFLRLRQPRSDEAFSPRPSKARRSCFVSHSGHCRRRPCSASFFTPAFHPPAFQAETNGPMVLYHRPFGSPSKQPTTIATATATATAAACASAIETVHRTHPKSKHPSFACRTPAPDPAAGRGRLIGMMGGQIALQSPLVGEVAFDLLAVAC